MVTQISNAVSRLRQPEYTGENRCTPCTVVNLLITTVAIAPVFALSPPVGLALFVSSLFVIYTRGYLVPGTPELTKRYLPPAVLRLFGKDAPQGTLGDLDETDLWTTLDAAGVVERNEDLSITDDFRKAWLAEIRTIREEDLGERAVERMLDVESAAQRGTRAFSIDGNQLVRWDSRAAFLADVAAATVFDERFEDWENLDRDTRRDLFERLRLLVERCPDCGGDVRRESESVDPCCQKSYTAVWTECGGCGAFLGELSVTTAGNTAKLAPLLASPEPTS